MNKTSKLFYKAFLYIPRFKSVETIQLINLRSEENWNFLLPQKNKNLKASIFSPEIKNLQNKKHSILRSQCDVQNIFVNLMTDFS